MDRIKNASIEQAFRNIIDAGLEKRRLGGVTFNLSSWKDYLIEMAIQPCYFGADRTRQFCKVRGISKIPNEIGFSTFAVILINLERVITEEEMKRDPLPTEILENEWIPTFIKYCPSHENPERIGIVDLGERHKKEK